MYRIALCDDETTELDKTEKLLSEYCKRHPGVDFEMEHFENADKLLHMVREEMNTPDLIFMDIYMPDKSGNKISQGIEVSRELRDIGYKGKLIFITMSKEYALEAFDVEASQYLVKPLSEEKLFFVLDRFLEEMEERKKYILLRIEGKLVRTLLNDIVFCEAQGKTQCLHLANGTQRLLRMTMTEMQEMLSPYPEFVRIGIAFIVNLGYIDSLNAREIHLDNGKRIYLPRGSYKSLKELYFRYYCGEE